MVGFLLELKFPPKLKVGLGVFEAIEDNTMGKPGVLNFEVGQLAEMRSFEVGFRGAWFRCKIKDIQLKKNIILPEYYDFDMDEPRWDNIYQVPPRSKKTKNHKRQLMVRPQYPNVYQKGEEPPVNTISQPCVVIDGTWKVGDKVDWCKDGCYWFATVVEVLSDDKFQVKLPMPPSGEGRKGEKGKYEAFCNDFRPSLDWSATKGWTFPTVKGHTSCDAQLIFPTTQGMDLEPDAGPEPEPAAAGSTTCKSGEGDRDGEQNEKSVRMDCDLMETSESDSSLQRKVAADEVEKKKLNITHEQTLEAAILDLEELVTKVKWMQRLLQSPGNDAATSSWKLV